MLFFLRSTNTCEALIKGLDLPHPPPAATCEVTEVPGSESRELVDQLASQRHIPQPQGPHLDLNQEIRDRAASRVSHLDTGT